MRGLFRAAFVVLLSGAALASNGLVESWTRYTNPRFGASAEIPPGYKAGEPPANGDGQGFDNSALEARVAVYGSINVESEDIGGRLTTLAGYAEQDGWQVSYRKAGKGWAAFSGAKDGRIFYERMILVCDGDTFNAVRLEYRAADKAAFDAVVARVTGSLRHDPQGGCA